MATLKYNAGIDFIEVWVEDVINNNNVRDYTYTCGSSEITYNYAKYTFTNLEPYTEYVISVRVNYEDDNVDECIPETVRTLPWSLETHNLNTVEGWYNDYFYLNTYTSHRYAVRFKNSGTVTIFTEGDVDTYGYLSDVYSNEQDKTTGEPKKYLESDDDEGEGRNFKFTYTVEADTLYYVWVKSIDGKDSGYITLCIEPPEGHYGGTLNAEATSNSITVTIIASPDDHGSIEKYEFFYRKSAETNAKTVVVETRAAYYSYTFEGLSPSTDYVVNGKIFYDDKTDSGLLVDDGFEVTTLARDSFQWNEDEVEAFTTNGKTTALTYDRWNEFVEYLQDVVTTHTKIWTGSSFTKTFNGVTYENVTFSQLLDKAKASSSDKKIYAYKFNIVRFTIGSGYGFGESEALPNAIHTHYTETNSWDMEPGEPVIGQYFIALVNQINLTLEKRT